MRINLSNAWTYLLIGCITMFYAEVLSGSSLLWFLKPSAILITFPFYTIHTLFFLNLAIRFERKSLLSLYFLGILYGLFEAWFTTVILYGYLNKTPVLGAFLGVSIWEFLALVFFWHPVMSFILSIATFEILARETKNGLVITSGTIINSKKPATYVIWLILFIIGSSVISLYSRFNILVALTSYIGSIIMIYIFYWLSKRQNVLSIENLVLSKRSLVVLGVMIVILYALGFLYHSGGVIVDYRAFIFISAFYMSVALLFYISKSTKNEKESLSENLGRNIWLIYLIGAILISINCILLASYGIPTILFLSIAFLGAAIFAISIALAIKT